MSRPIAPCKVCGGRHTPKCRPSSRREDAAVWRGILDKWKTEKTRGESGKGK